jgi:GDP-4-dehydro-6-deoxy-D-mannose reductase
VRLQSASSLPIRQGIKGWLQVQEQHIYMTQTDMKKYLITGYSGFVSRHFLEFLEAQGTPASVLGVDTNEPAFDVSRFRSTACRFEKLDLKDEIRTQELVKAFQPDYVLHLASHSSVHYSWKNPAQSFRNNTTIFLNLLETVRSLSTETRILSIGSSEEYGDVSQELPLREDHPLKPVSPYAVARVSQGMLSQVYVNSFGMDIVSTRSFNHIGPGQSEVFVASSFGRQIAAASKDGLSSLAMKTGDLSIVRDFTDVRDVVRAYHLLLTKGRKGEVYNVCSGQGISLTDFLQKMSQKAGVKVTQTTDPALVRPSDNRAIVGSNEKIFAETGWKPEIPLDRSLGDILLDWKDRLGNGVTPG